MQKRNERDVHQEEVASIEAELQMLQRRIAEVSEPILLTSEEKERVN